jgi:hypothetical protein
MHFREEIFGHGFRFAKHADFTDTSPFYRDLRGVRGANMKELLEIDRLKKRETLRGKSKLACFCSSRVPIYRNAMHWNPRAAGFSAIYGSHPGNPGNPV